MSIKKDNETDNYLEHVVEIPINGIINSVITLKEACEILQVGETTLRTRVLNGEFLEWECRKAGGVILFCRKAIEGRKDTFRLRKRNNSK